MLLNTLEEDPYWDDRYCEWLEETCMCDIQEDGCSCLSFNKWFDEKQEEQTILNCDY